MSMADFAPIRAQVPGQTVAAADVRAGERVL